MSSANLDFGARASAEKQRFVAALRDARGEQARLFRDFVDSNVDTAFGREHGLSTTMSLADYRGAVPIRRYEALLPWIERTLAGEPAVLTALPPMLFYSTTGTSGAPKLAPVTREFAVRWGRNLLVHWGNLVERFPELLARDDTVATLHLAPRPFAKWTQAGIPLHLPTEMPAEAGGIFPFSRAPWFPPPAEATDAARLGHLLRLTVESPLVAVMCLHSSRLQAFASRLRDEGPSLVRQVHDGLVDGQPSRTPNPARASELERVIAEHGALTPRHVWPSLRFVSCWIGSSFDLYEPDLKAGYGETVVPQMTVSSEVGHMTMPIGADQLDGPLTVQTNFYEFLPADELEGHGERTLAFDELEIGPTYALVATTCSGMYRYLSGDLFRVSDFYEGVPRMQFVGRSGTSDLAGEKLTEAHVNLAWSEALRTCGLATRGATVCARWGKPAHYVAVVEPAGVWSIDDVRRLEHVLDEVLRRVASRYDLKRGFGDLGPLVVERVAEGAFGRYRARRIAGGTPATQLKDKVLHVHEEWATLRRLLVDQEVT